MRPAVIGMRGFATHLMETIGQTVQIHSHPGTERDRTNRKAPIYRKYVKRREKLETTKHRGTSIQVSVVLFVCLFVCLSNVPSIVSVINSREKKKQAIVNCQL